MSFASFSLAFVMPMASRNETIVGIPEVMDGIVPMDDAGSDISTTGFAVKTRASCLHRCTTLGPPDMLYLRKRRVPLLGSPKLFGYYHFVRGVDPSSVGKISAYIADVVRNNGLEPLPWVHSAGWEVTSATFLSYNIISKVDLVVHVNFPGTTSATAINQESRAVPLTDLFWNELLVSSVIRNISGHGETPLYPCLRVLSTGSAAQDEAQFWASSLDCASRWHLSNENSVQDSSGCPVKSTVAFKIRDYFFLHARFDPAIHFFSNEALQIVDSRFPLYAATAARLKGDIETATQITQGVLSRESESSLAWIELSHIYYAEGKVGDALEAAKKAASFAAGDVDVWIFLCTLYLNLKDYNQALLSLNSVNIPSPEMDPYLRELVPYRKLCTVPLQGSSRGTDAVRVFVEKVRAEENVPNENDPLSLSKLPSRAMSDIEQKCYSVLVDIFNDLSWDGFLLVRSACFVMEADLKNAIDADEMRHREEMAPSDSQNEMSRESTHVEQEAMSVSNETSTPTVQKDSSGLEEGTDARIKQAVDNPYLRKIIDGKNDKRVCKLWLEYLVKNLHQDLMAMADWEKEEQIYMTKAHDGVDVVSNHSDGSKADVYYKKGHEENASGGKRDVMFSSMRRNAAEVIETSSHSPAVWLHRGELATRLKKLETAKTAFWVCVKLCEREKNTAVAALCHLMKLSCQDGDIKTCLRCGDKIWKYIDISTDQISADRTMPLQCVRKNVFNLVSKKGLREVRNVLMKEVDIDRKGFEGILLDAVAQRVHGFLL